MPAKVWEREEHDPASSVFVGDSEVDASTAAAAGVPFVLMTHGYHRGPLNDIQCLAAFDHFKYLADFLAVGEGGLGADAAECYGEERE